MKVSSTDVQRIVAGKFNRKEDADAFMQTLAVEKVHFTGKEMPEIFKIREGMIVPARFCMP